MSILRFLVVAQEAGDAVDPFVDKPGQGDQ